MYSDVECVRSIERMGGEFWVSRPFSNASLFPSFCLASPLDPLLSSWIRQASLCLSQQILHTDWHYGRLNDSSSLQVPKVQGLGSKGIHCSNLAFARRYSRVMWCKGWRWEESRIIQSDTKIATVIIKCCRRIRICRTCMYAVQVYKYTLYKPHILFYLLD